MTPGTTSDATFASAPGASFAEARPASAPILICLPPASSDSLAKFLEAVHAAFPQGNVVVAGAEAFDGAAAGITTVAYNSPRANLGWVLGAGDYTAAANSLGDRTYSGVVIVGNEFTAGSPELLASFTVALQAGADFVVPRFATGPTDGLVSSGILYPMTRSLFGADIRFPLPVVAGLSQRMLQRLHSTAQRLAPDALMWPVTEAAVAGYPVREIQTDMRTPPPPPEDDLNKLLSTVASSLFLEVDSKASFWQRSRVLNRQSPAPPTGGFDERADTTEEITEIVENFRLAYANLLEIWALVLPPQTLVALKRLSQASPATFHLPPELWARIVYEFALAFHLRTLNRGHLLGALTPLYLAWVASHVRAAGSNAEVAAQLVEATASAFEREKPYLVSRWRWPDRFNP